MQRHTLPTLLAVLFVILQCFNAQANEDPQRIISLGPINTENVFLLGAGHRLIANTNYCVRPQAAIAKEKIGTVMQVSIEKIIGLRPDLVLATGLTQRQQLRQLESAGIKVVRFSHPASFAEICSQFRTLGQILNLEQRANEIIQQAQKQVAKLQKKLADSPVQKVFLQVGAQPIFSSIPGSFTNDFITLAGGINIAAGQQNGIIHYEKVISANPDVIIIAIMGSESGIAAEEKEKWMRIPVINAVRNNRVHTISPDIACSPSPETFAKTLNLIATMIHPEIPPSKRE